MTLEPRQRKSRSGCKRCKERKVKCDEGLPNCAQCIRQGYLCPGYEKRVSFFELREISGSQLKISRRKRSQLHQSSHETIQLGLCDITSDLINYYFSNVCPVISCFDSSKNLIRHGISDLILISETISTCVQAIAAAHLSKYQPSQLQHSISLQSRALELLRSDIHRLADGGTNVDEKLIFVVTLLGMSEPWHNPQGNGKQHFAAAKALIVAWLSNQPEHPPSVLTELMIPMLIYWEMLASFVMDDGSGIISHLQIHHPDFRSITSGNSLDTMLRKVKLHPLTGVSTELFVLVARVGHLVRKKTIAIWSIGQTVDSCASHNDPEIHKSFRGKPQWTDMVEDCEEALLAYETPALDDVEDTQDSQTPVEDLLNITEAYRYAALLQVYRVCPHLLETRLSVVNGERYPTRVKDADYGKLSRNTADPKLEAAADEFLYGFATKTLECIAKISPASRTRPIQPLILVMVANELRLSTESTASDKELHRKDYRSCRDWRNFLWERLTVCVNYVPQTPIAINLDVVKEMWSKIDAGKRVFWLEIVFEHGWETLLG